MRKLWRTGPARAGGVALATALTLGLAGPGAAQTDGYPDYDGLSAELREITGGTDLARLSSIATTIEGREVWMVELGDPDGTPLDQRPALLVVANLSADHLVGSRLAIDGIRRILERAETDADVATLLSENVLYVVPRANPDGAEAFFGPLLWDRRTNARPYDDDNDGRVDEDGPNDLNGDGMITVMRVLDPEGAYIVHPDDARLMKRASATDGEAGRYTLYWEGVDDDGDGWLNEDLPGGVDLDRNFQHEHPYYQADAGPHMVSEPETRALVDFAVAHRNIGAILTYGHHDNLVTAPNAQGRLAGTSLPDLHLFAAAGTDGVLRQGVYSVTPDGIRGGLDLRGAQPGRDNDPQSGRRPAVTVNSADVPYFEAVAEAYRELTGLGSTPMNREAQGAFFQYGYYQYGVPSFTTQGWTIAEGEGDMAPARGATLEQRVLSGGADDLFVAWTPVDHPDFDQVEVGGFVPGAFANPDATTLGDAGAAQGDFMVALAGMLPRISIAETEVENHGGGIFTVSAVIENTGYFPTALQHGVVSGAVDATMAQLRIDAADIITGDAKSPRVQSLDGSGHRARFTWVIRGRNGQNVEIFTRAQKGGTDSVTVTLR